MYNPIDDDEDLDTQMLRRIRNMKLGPLTFKEAKEETIQNKRCSKPPTKVEKKNMKHLLKHFRVVDKKDHGIHEDFQLKVVSRKVI